MKTLSLNYYLAFFLPGLIPIALALSKTAWKGIFKKVRTSREYSGDGLMSPCSQYCRLRDDGLPPKYFLSCFRLKPAPRGFIRSR